MLVLIIGFGTPAEREVPLRYRLPSGGACIAAALAELSRTRAERVGFQCRPVWGEPA